MTIRRQIQIADREFELSLNNPVIRYSDNPILTCHDVNSVWERPEYKTITIHNAGISMYNDQVVMLFRSHLRNGISVIGKATSEDGVGNWTIDTEPAIKPCKREDLFAAGREISELIVNEAGGVEDPRISKIGSTYYITYSAYHGSVKDRVRVSLAKTEDFRSFTRYGPVLDRDMRNVVLFPEKIGEYYYALMRPNDDPGGDHTGGVFKEIRLARNRNILNEPWEILPDPVMKQGGGPSTFGDKIGPGAPPIKSGHGWINIFHGVRSTMDGNPYCLGVALHDLDDPSRVLVSNIPILFPSAADCKVAGQDYVHVPNVVFTCGAFRVDNGTIFIYYGGNDTVMNLAFSHEDILAELCIKYPQDPLTGMPKYDL
jgi:predicted GH43/DUF377 family glycosyl hydrolase